MTGLLHQTYLPFPASLLKTHFVHAGETSVSDYLRYYEASMKRAAKLAEKMESGARPSMAEIRAGRQFEKDERFWIAASLMSLYHVGDEARRNALFGDLLRAAGLDHPADFSSWEDALGPDLRLLFEVTLPAPAGYKDWLRENLDSRAPIPYIREAAQRPRVRFEGSTWADALLISSSTGVAVAFEAKVLSDCSVGITYDVSRNQIARYIDVLLEANTDHVEPLNSRRPDLSYFVLLTPEQFRDTPGTRLYSFLMDDYRNADGTLLREHLKHRAEEELIGVEKRLGWATWEDINDILPGGCPWLGPVSTAA